MNHGRLSLAHLMKSVLFCAGLVVMLLAVDFVMRPTAAALLPWAALADTRNEADVIVLGSSRAHCTVLPMEMWRSDGITAVDVTAGGQVISASLAYLEEALRRQQPEVVMLEVSQTGSNAFSDLPRAHGNFDDMPLGMPKVSGVLRSMPATSWPEFLIPLHIYHSRWRELTSYDYLLDKRSRFGFARGALYLPMVEPQSETVTYGVLREAEYRRDLTYIKTMIVECQERGATMVLFTAPSWARLKVGEELLLDRLQSDLRGEFPSVGYLDMNAIVEETGVDPGTDWKDKSHLNHRGARKITGWLAEYLVKNYRLADHRGEEMATRWNADLRKYDEMFIVDW